MQKRIQMSSCRRAGDFNIISVKYIFILCFLLVCVSGLQMSTTTEDEELEFRKSYPWRWQAPFSYLHRNNLFYNDDNLGSSDEKAEAKPDTESNSNVNNFNDQYLENIMPNFYMNNKYNKRRALYNMYNTN